jgi:hypothetical protein
MAETEKFSVGFYVRTVTRMLGQPRQFFTDLQHEASMRQSLGFLVISSLFFAGAAVVSSMSSQPILMGTIYFVNSFGMAFIAAGVGYIVMTMSMGKKATFTRLFGIYALSSGLTLLASWLPFFVWLTEPWKWWLIGTGMTMHCGFSRKQAILVIGASIIVMVLAFYSVLPVVSHLRPPAPEP